MFGMNEFSAVINPPQENRTPRRKATLPDSSPLYHCARRRRLSPADAAIARWFVQAAILAVGAGMPVCELRSPSAQADGVAALAERTAVTLRLSADARVLSADQAKHFLSAVSELLADPSRMLL
jgi:hypothetical protein